MSANLEMMLLVRNTIADQLPVRLDIHSLREVAALAKKAFKQELKSITTDLGQSIDAQRLSLGSTIATIKDMPPASLVARCVIKSSAHFESAAMLALRGEMLSEFAILHDINFGARMVPGMVSGTIDRFYGGDNGPGVGDAMDLIERSGIPKSDQAQLYLKGHRMWQNGKALLQAEHDAQEAEGIRSPVLTGFTLLDEVTKYYSAEPNLMMDDVNYPPSFYAEAVRGGARFANRLYKAIFNDMVKVQSAI